MKHSQGWMIVRPIVFGKVTGERSNYTKNHHGWKQDPHRIGFVKLNDQFKPVFWIVSNHKLRLVLKSQDHVANNPHAIHQLFFCNNQGRRKANDVTMRRFC